MEPSFIVIVFCYFLLAQALLICCYENYPCYQYKFQIEKTNFLTQRELIRQTKQHYQYYPSSSSIHQSYYPSPFYACQLFFLASSTFISATASSISSLTISPFCLACSYSYKYYSQSTYLPSLKEQNDNMQSISNSLLMSSCSFQKSYSDFLYYSTSNRYLPAVVTASFSYSSLPSVIHLWIYINSALALSKSSVHIKQLAICNFTSIHVWSILNPFSITSLHFAQASFQLKRSVRQTSAIPAYACAISLLVYASGAVDLKGLAKHFKAYSIPFSKVFIDLTPSYISANSKYLLQLPTGISLIDLYSIFLASSSFCVVLSKLQQQSTSISSCGFL